MCECFERNVSPGNQFRILPCKSNKFVMNQINLPDSITEALSNVSLLKKNGHLKKMLRYNYFVEDGKLHFTFVYNVSDEEAAAVKREKECLEKALGDFCFYNVVYVRVVSE
jgi:hypothetical protein